MASRFGQQLMADLVGLAAALGEEIVVAMSLAPSVDEAETEDGAMVVAVAPGLPDRVMVSAGMVAVMVVDMAAFVVLKADKPPGSPNCVSNDSEDGGVELFGDDEDEDE
jgi:hypothetical protein